MLDTQGNRVRTSNDRVPEQAAAVRPGGCVASEEMSPAEAVQAFNVSESSLRRLLAADSIPARKVAGRRGREWRIEVSALEEAGYTRRATANSPEVQHAEVRQLRGALTVERARASLLDGQLGYALLTIGRLRGRLRDAGINPDELFGADIYADRDQQPSQAPHMA